jgi:hypothetical protein
VFSMFVSCPCFTGSVLLIGFVDGLRSILSDGSVVVAHNTIQDIRHDTPRFVLLVFQSLFDSLVGGCRCALLRAVINSWSISDSHENLVRSCCAFNYLDVFLDFVWLQGYSVSPSLWVYGNLFVSLSLSFLF